MKKVVVSSFTIFCLLSSVLIAGLTLNIHPVKALSVTIYIRADGSVDPPTAPISTLDNVTYILTNNINGSIIVEKDNIVIDGANLTLQGRGSGNGIDLSARNNVTVISTEVRSFWFGIWISDSSDIIIFGNNISNNDMYGIYLQNCFNITVSKNNLTNNTYGIQIMVSSHCGIFKNNVNNNSIYGIYMFSSSNNTVYHNNLVDNGWESGAQVFADQSPDNNWDDGYPSGGNYWSDYDRNDTNHDGIGDYAYVIDPNNTDKYPLMGMFTDFNATSEHNVQTICNSSISNFQWGDESRVLSFSFSGEDGTIGFCRIGIPRNLMEGPYVVMIDGELVDSTKLPISNSTHVFLYFTFTHSTHTVEITPELWYLYADLLDKYMGLLVDFASLNSTFYQHLDDYALLLNNYGQLIERFNALNTSYQGHLKDYYELQENHTSLQNSYDQLLLAFNTLNISYIDLKDDYDSLSSICDSLQAAYDELDSRYNSLDTTFNEYRESTESELGYIRNLMYIFIAATVILIVTTAYLVVKRTKAKTRTTKTERNKK